jgi:spermidine synthase
MASTILPAIFFFSGCAALIFENLWFYQARITFGNSVWASSLVLAGFMGGLALGNALAARLRPGRFRAVRVYAGLELAIGISGFALVLGLPFLTPVLARMLGPLLSSPWLANPLRLGIAFALLLVPSTAMGATLPVMVSALYRRDPRFGSVLGRLYGWNTLGAVVGALAGDVVLIEALGVRGTGLAACAISLSVAGLAFASSGRLEGSEDIPSKEPSRRPEALSGKARWLLVATAIAGFTLLGLEVLWFRFLLHFTHGSSQTFAILLATVLAGIALGGLFGGFVASSQTRVQRLLPGVAVLTGLVCILLYWGHPGGPPNYGWGPTLSRGLSLMFPVAFLSGVLFTLLGAALKEEIDTETRAAGLLTLANTTGATAGPLVAGFFLLPAFGLDRSVQILSALYLALGGAVWVARQRPDGRKHQIATGAVAVASVAALLAFPAGPTLERHLEPVVDPFTRDIGAETVAMREGVTETIIYTEFRAFGEPVWYRMLTNGYSMSGTSVEGQRYMKLFVYLPMALNPNMKSALLISYGVGSTAQALTNTRSLESIDVVDISKDVLEMNEIVFPKADELPLNDPRVKVHVEDGRYFLQTTGARFDLITGEPPPPKKAGIVTLYTREYFALVYDRLNEGGIFSYWLPVHVLSPDDSKAIIAAFCDIFEDCTLWGGSALDWILLGTRNARGPDSAEGFARQWKDPVVGPDLAALAVERPEQLNALFMGGPSYLKKQARDALPLTDDFPKRLSDGPFDVSAGVEDYIPWMNQGETRRRFEQSAWLDRVWPAQYREGDPQLFLAQWEINRTLIEKPYDLRIVLPRVHEFLTATDLSTVPLWMLQSHELRQRAARTALEKGNADPSTHYELGLAALAQRNYWRAYELFDKAGRSGLPTQRVQTLMLYSLFMAKGPSERRELIAELRATGAAANVEPWLVPFLEEAMASL